MKQLIPFILVFLLLDASCRKSDNDTFIADCGELLIGNYTYDPGDDFQYTDAYMVGDFLRIAVNYDGGCENHCFRLIWSGTVSEIVYVFLNHYDNEDECEAYLYEEIDFDLTAMKNRIQNFDPNIDEVEIIIENYYPPGPLYYVF